MLNKSIRNEAIFRFEDDGIDDEIVQPRNDNIKSHLSYRQFHKLDDLEIATIMDTSLMIVEQAIMEASRDLGDSN